MSDIISVTGDTFEAEVLESDVPVLVEFFKPNCKPCKKMAPLLEAAATKLNGQMKVCQVDGSDEANADLVAEHNIPGYPRVLFFTDGKRIARTGALDMPQLRQRCANVINGAAAGLGA